MSSKEPAVRDAESTKELDLPSDIERIVGGRYELVDKLGEGGFAIVYKARHTELRDLFYAIKILRGEHVGQAEVIKKFRHEAVLLSSLRCPQTVRVMDFGVTNGSPYFVMEFVTGVSLETLLTRHGKLPAAMVARLSMDILESLAEAHTARIVHRDIKPANVLVVAGFGGGPARAKVLDFGIAKVGEHDEPLVGPTPARPGGGARPTIHVTPLATGELPPGAAPGGVPAPPTPPTPPTPADLVAGSGHASPSPAGTTPEAHLTRPGAILGTPWFMSPEQCRGDTLDARSDIYSLGVIAYQMLAGTPRFQGEAGDVLKAHLDDPPPPLRGHARHVPEGVAKIIMAALAKAPADRPPSALAFSNAVRANADGLGRLYRQAFSLYSEYFPSFLLLSVLAHAPSIALSLGTILLQLATYPASGPATGTFAVSQGILKALANFLTPSVISGVTAIIVAQLAVAPFRPVRLRPAFVVLLRNWRPFLWTGFQATLRIALGFLLLFLPGIVMLSRYSFWPAVVLMEGSTSKPALARSRTLAARSWPGVVITASIATLFTVAFPAAARHLMAGAMGVPAPADSGLRSTIASELAGLTSILLDPVLSIVPALLYIKLRQLGGETPTEMMAHIEEETGTSRWETRLRWRSRTGTTPRAR